MWFVVIETYLHTYTNKQDQTHFTPTMWPAKEIIGPQLTYGVLGNGLVTPGPLPSGLGPVLKFPRLRDHAPQLHLIEHSSRTLAPGVPREDIDTKVSVYSTHHRHPNDVNVPEDVAASLAIEARPLRDGIALDPTNGSLATIFGLQTGHTLDLDYSYDLLYLLEIAPTFQVTAFITGSGQLKVMPLLEKKRNVFDTKFPEKLQKLPLDCASEKHCFETQIPWPVKQIVVSADCRLLAVRGHAECCVFSIGWDNEQSCVKVLEAFTIKNAGAEWSEVTFNTSSLAFVSTRGTITIYDFQRTKHGYKFELKHNIDPSIYAPLDWSSWKRVCWPLGADYLILFSRKAAHYIQLGDEPGKRVVKKLVTTHYWSHFQDVAIVDSNIFLFTSKEIIWLLTTLEQPFKRILSWKHYLDDADASLKLSVCPNKSGTYTLSVYSQETPIIIAYTFGTVDGRPCSVHDPYILYSSENAGVAHLALAESLNEDDNLSSLANCVEISCDSEVTLRNFCGLNYKRVRPENSAPKEPPQAFKPLKIFSTRELDLVYRYLGVEGSEAGRKLEIAALTSEGSENSEASQKLITNGDATEDTTIADTPSVANETNTDHNIHVPTETKNDKNLQVRQQIDVVQNYAFELGAELKNLLKNESPDAQDENGAEGMEPTDQENTNSLYPQYHTLASLAENVPTEVTNLKEFDSMLHQLNEYCVDQGGRLDFGSPALLKGPSDGSLSSEYFHDHILGMEDPAKSRAAVILALCMVRAHSTNIAKQHKELIQKELEGCSEDLKDIFGEWPAHEPESSKSHTPSQAQAQAQTQSLKGKRGLLHRALTQSSQAFQVTSTQKSDLNGSSKPKPQTSQTPPTLQTSLSQANSQESDTLFISQFQSSQESLGSDPFSSQAGGSQSLKRSSQLGARRKKKKKGGFA